MGKRFLRLTHLLLPLLAAIACSEFAEEEVSPHPSSWIDGHVVKVQTLLYDFDGCAQCHGADLQAGTDRAPGCSTGSCHAEAGGVNACTTCHGFTQTEPFENVAGDTTITVLSVGQHSAHIFAYSAIANPVSCDACHVMPWSNGGATHIDTSEGAEVTFSGLAVPSHSGYSGPVWDRTSASCSNTYCHGNFVYSFQDSLITGNSASMVWNEPFEPTDECAVCHGYPPDGHPTFGGNADLTQCGNLACHGSVISGSDNRTIITPSLHINGQADTFSP